MRNLNPTSWTTTRASSARRARLLFVLGALLLCGAARAQEPKVPDLTNGGTITQQEYERILDAAAMPRPSLNVKPLEDVALKGKQLVEAGRLGPYTTLDVSATAERAVDGRLKPETVQLSGLDGADHDVAALAMQLVTAVSESRMLAILDGATTIRLGLKLDGRNVSVLVSGLMPSADKARQTADGYAILVKMATQHRAGTAEARLYDRLRFASEDKVFKMSFEMPRDEAARMIADMLAKKAARAAASQD